LIIIASKDSVTKYDSFDRYTSTLDGWYKAHERAVEADAKDQKQKCGHCGGTHLWPEDKCHHKKDNNDKSKGNGGLKDYKYEQRIKDLASRLLTKVLKKEMPEVHKQKGSSTGTDSDSDDASANNDAFMSQMRDKLETCHLIDHSSKHSDDYFQAYTFRPTEAKSNDVSGGHYMAETIIEIENRLGQLVTAQALLDTGTTESIVLRHLVRKGRAHTKKGMPTVWNTLGGKYKTTRKALNSSRIQIA
jgi:hypothetical protein